MASIWATSSTQKKLLLSIQAHPDDSDLFAGGTIVRFIEEGWDVDYVCVTDGSVGTTRLDTKPEELTARRRDEQLRAANVLGVRDVVFLDYEDSRLSQTLELRGRLIMEIRKRRPQIVMTHDPWKPYQIHPDHRHTGFMATEAAFFAKLPHVEPSHLADGLTTFRVDAVYLFDTASPNTIVDTTKTFEQKIRALGEHTSQMPDELVGTAKNRDSALGRQSSMAYAEGLMKLW